MWNLNIFSERPNTKWIANKTNECLKVKQSIKKFEEECYNLIPFWEQLTGYTGRE